MAHVTETSPFAYAATFSFVMSACSSDLLGIRLSLTCGFLFLVLAAVSGQSSDGSFDYIPLRDDDEINIPMFVNMCLFLLNAFICSRLIGDDRSDKSLNDQEMALFRFFQARCGLTPLQFRYILRNGEFVELPARTDVPNTHCTLYLVLEGRVQCRAKQQGNLFGKGFVKRSGEFFDVKLFNLFTIPVGFDSIEFMAKTETAVKLFAWKVDGIVAMRENKSPTLLPFWHVMVLRAVAGVAIRHHLKSNETLYDSLLIPERSEWLEGAPSRDFVTRQQPTGNWHQFRQQLRQLQSSLWHIIPPHGVRHRPDIAGNNPKQAYMELVCRTTVPTDDTFHFLDSVATNKTRQKDEEEGDRGASS